MPGLRNVMKVEHKLREEGLLDHDRMILRVDWDGYEAEGAGR